MSATTSTSTKMPVRLLALSIAISQLGVTETAKNSSPMIDRYLAAVGLKPGYAWCQAFFYWIMAEAARLMNQAVQVVKTAGVADCWNKTDARYKVTAEQLRKDPSKVVPGAQFILVFSNGTGHTGIVERVEGRTMYTIEGNSNNTGSREGISVVRHTRSIDAPEFKGVIIYP